MALRMSLLDIITESLFRGDKLTAVKACGNLCDVYELMGAQLWDADDVGNFIRSILDLLVCLRVSKQSEPTVVRQLKNKLANLQETLKQITFQPVTAITTISTSTIATEQQRQS
jgi:hypothetical protein